MLVLGPVRTQSYKGREVHLWGRCTKAATIRLSVRINTVRVAACAGAAIVCARASTRYRPHGHACTSQLAGCIVEGCSYARFHAASTASAASTTCRIKSPHQVRLSIEPHCTVWKLPTHRTIKEACKVLSCFHGAQSCFSARECTMYMFKHPRNSQIPDWNCNLQCKCAKVTMSDWRKGVAPRQYYGWS